ncbi:MAG: 1-phosphofructokinase [Fusobacteriaceae bacterium]|jgi:1-phosphofructokinase|nr:1-phosphofructokinase [Fusobacteriaceae bacterium]
MIFTITLNPAADYYVTVDSFMEGGLNLASESYLLAGGKGINVSKVLKNYGVQSIATGFAGGSNGELIRTTLREYGIIDRFVGIRDNTRLNIKLKTAANETEITGKAPEIPGESYAEFLKMLSDIGPHDYAVLSGSVPPSLPETVYAEIIQKLPRETRVILDTRGRPFIHALREGVHLTKPNKKELGEYLGREIHSMDELVAGARELREMGSENVLVSAGGEAAALVTPRGTWIGETPSGTVVSSAGAGDSMVAGILYGLSRGLSVEESFAGGIASGSATAFKKDLAELPDMEKLLNRIKIRRL